MIYAFVKIIVILDVARRYVWGRWRVTMRRRWSHRHMEHGAQMVLGHVARDDECHEPSTALIGDKNTPSAFPDRRSHRSSEVEQTGPPLERAISAAGGCKLAPERSEESASSSEAYGHDRGSRGKPRTSQGTRTQTAEAPRTGTACRGIRGAYAADYQILIQNSPLEIRGAVFVIYLCINYFCATDGSQLTDPASLSHSTYPH